MYVLTVHVYTDNVQEYLQHMYVLAVYICTYRNINSDDTGVIGEGEWTRADRFISFDREDFWLRLGIAYGHGNLIESWRLRRCTMQVWLLYTRSVLR